MSEDDSTTIEQPKPAKRPKKERPICMVYPSSPAGQAAIAGAAQAALPPYPLAELQVGQSFAVSSGYTTKPSLDTLCSLVGPYLKARYKVIVHKDLALFEVARIA